MIADYSTHNIDLLSEEIDFSRTAFLIATLSDCSFCRRLMRAIEFDAIRGMGVRTIHFSGVELSLDVKRFERKYNIDVWPSCWLYRHGELVSGMISDRTLFDADIATRITNWVSENLAKPKAASHSGA